MKKQLLIIDDDSAFKGSSRNIGDVGITVNYYISPIQQSHYFSFNGLNRISTIKLAKQNTGQSITQTNTLWSRSERKTWSLSFKRFSQNMRPGKDLKRVWNKNNCKVELISLLIPNKR